MDFDSTIAAISTAPGRGALSIVRVSGPETLGVAERLGIPNDEKRIARRATLLHPTSGLPLDDVIAVVYARPASYTGEDMVEITCHGGSLTPQLVLAAVCEAGARLAEAGEFTRRAYLNGKMDLVQAEAVLDVIEARSPALHRAALFQLERGLSRRIERLRSELIEMQALLAYDIDFPEEDDGPIPGERIERTGEELRGQLERMLALAPEGELLREGALTVIAGRPNTGKSSIFNMLLGFERALVTEEPGTTRDAIEATVTLGGYPFRLVDTAGLRQDAGRIEAMGIEVARGYLQAADVVLFCVEAVREPDAEEREFVERAAGAGVDRVVALRTKCDLAAGRIAGSTGAGREVAVSSVTGEGLPLLRDALLGRVYAGIRAAEETPVVTRARHVAALERALADVRAFLRARSEGMPPEIAGTHIQDATLALEDLLGVVTMDDVLDRVFSDFCVGK